MNRCEYNDFPCQDPDYDNFDKMAGGELSNPIDSSALVNLSEFCMIIPIEEKFSVGDLDHKLYLKTLKGQSGLYHLWIDYESAATTIPIRCCAHMLERDLQIQGLLVT